MKSRLKILILVFVLVVGIFKTQGTIFAGDKPNGEHCSDHDECQSGFCLIREGAKKNVCAPQGADCWPDQSSLVNSDCSLPGYFCNRETWVCEEEEEHSCSDDQYWLPPVDVIRTIEEKCVPKKPNGTKDCTNNFECLSGYCWHRGLWKDNVCAPQGADCVAEGPSPDCGEGEVCQDWRCVKDSASHSACKSTNDCGDNEYCSYAAVWEAFKGADIDFVRSHSRTEIPADASGECVLRKATNGMCWSDNECLSGYFCQGVDIKDNKAGKCISKEELPDETGQVQCGDEVCDLTREYCDSGWSGKRCVAKLGPGDECSKDEQCLSGYCDQEKTLDDGKAFVCTTKKYVIEHDITPVLYGARTLPGEIDFGFVKLKPENWVDFLYHLLLSFGGFISLVMIIVNSIKLMTSGHNPEEVQNAIKGIQQALLGLALVLIGAAIVTFVNNLAIGGLG